MELRRNTNEMLKCSDLVRGDRSARVMLDLIREDGHSIVVQQSERRTTLTARAGGETWVVRAPDPDDAVCELAGRLGWDLE